jgi:hypothetical protein
MRAAYAPPVRRDPLILGAIAEKLKRRSKDDFKGRHYEASLILQAVSWNMRYPLSYRDIEELFLERGLEVDHATLNRWVLGYAPLIERRLRAFRKPHCGSIRIDVYRAVQMGLSQTFPDQYGSRTIRQCDLTFGC